MINFDMSTQENFAHFKDSTSEIHVFVDSFDNKEFNVRIGSIRKSTFVGSIYAEDDETLNEKLRDFLLQSKSLNHL